MGTFPVNNVKMFQDKFKDKNATMYHDNNVTLFQGSNVKMYQEQYQDKNARMYQGKSVTTFPESNVKMYPGNSVKMFHVNNVTKFHGNNVETFQNKNAETYQDKFVNKLVTAVNNFFDIIEENSEQSQAIITSPISIMLYQSYVIFISMSTLD